MKNPFNHQAWLLLFNFRKNNGLPLLFIVLIFLPLADQSFIITNPQQISENRILATKPVFQLRGIFTYFKKYELYFNDNANFRKILLILHNTIMIRYLKTSPLEKTIVGKNGWLFLAREDEKSNALDYYRALKPFSFSELRQWKTALRQRQEWCSQRGITYLFVVAPNKSSIYPEFMPANIRRLRKQNRLDQLLDYLKKEPAFPIIDFREILLQKKPNFLLFSKTDTHWNPLGAYFAYVKIIESLATNFPELKPFLQDHFIINERNNYGDLSKVLSLNKKYFLEAMVNFEAKFPIAIQSIYPKHKYGRDVSVTIDMSAEAKSSSLLIVHDSFVDQLRPFLSPHFRRVFYIGDRKHNFYKDLIEKENIKIVIDQIAERFLLNLALKNLVLFKKPAAQKQPGHD